MSHIIFLQVCYCDQPEQRLEVPVAMHDDAAINLNSE